MSSRDSFAEKFCPECENMLLTGSQFCIVCGSSVRSSSHQARKEMRTGSHSDAPTTDGGAA
ncbi:MAG: hypothetical protein M3237_11495 [Actinomycetota bacterium]|nr:hypothetical protein [Actinomycetota bacterium]